MTATASIYDKKKRQAVREKLGDMSIVEVTNALLENEEGNTKSLDALKKKRKVKKSKK